MLWAAAICTLAERNWKSSRLVTNLIKLGSNCRDVEGWDGGWTHPFIGHNDWGHVVSPIFFLSIQEFDACGAGVPGTVL